jgi:dTDP-4-dehydrorhamnose 3,5-epimerase
VDVVSLELLGLKLIKPSVHRDARGFFLEAYRASAYADHGIDVSFIQDNHSLSQQGTLRGMHWQKKPGQAKLVRVAAGKIFDVAVDVRAGSPTFGRWVGVTLDAVSHHQLFVPVGFLHGFCVLEGPAEVLYKVSSPYDAAQESSVAWNDPDIGIGWPVDRPMLSARDAAAPSLAQLRAELRAGDTARAATQA